MRRLAVVCAVLLLASAGFVAVQKHSSIAFASAQSAADTSGITSTAKVTVVATGIPVRAIALGLVDSNSLYLTRADAPTQIFEIQSANLSSSTGNRLSAVAGTPSKGSLGDGGPATSAELDLNATSLVERSGIAIADDGALYVADTGNSTIRAVAAPNSTEPGIIRSVAGRWATSQSSALAEPLGLALDHAGNLFIADHGAGVVAMLSPTGQVKLLAHVASPASIVVTPSGKTAFVASPETGAILAIDLQTNAINSVKGFAAVSSPPACGVSVAPANASVCPAGLAVDALGNLFVSDSNSGRILRVDAQNAHITALASGLKAPGALAMDSQGNLYAAEQGANRILAFAQVGTSQGSLSLTPTSASYGNEPSGGVTTTQAFTLSASSSVTGLNIPKATAPADFTVESNNCTTTLAANSSCTLNVAFTPTTTGARSATLAVTDSISTDSASTVLNGTGDDYELQLANGQLTSISIQAGAAATFNLQVVPDTVFSGTVAFACPSNLPTNTTCAFSPSTVNVTPGTPTAFNVTFQTTGIVNPLTTWLPVSGVPPSDLISIPLFLGIGASLFWLSRNRAPWVGAAVVTVAIVALLAGCNKGTAPATIGATPAGTYTMAVTGNSQNASRAFTITLNVVQK